jgi:hypothetical protein
VIYEEETCEQGNGCQKKKGMIQKSTRIRKRDVGNKLTQKTI